MPTTSETRTPTHEVMERVKALANDDIFRRAIWGLMARWEYESEFENIQDYRAILQSAGIRSDHHPASVQRMTKRPFGAKITVAGFLFHFQCRKNGQFFVKFVR